MLCWDRLIRKAVVIGYGLDIDSELLVIELLTDEVSRFCDCGISSLKLTKKQHTDTIISTMFNAQI